MKSATFLLLLLFLATAHAAGHAPVVRTSEGILRGAALPGVEAYLGIPYAKAPVGALRWRSPEKPLPWRHPRSATHFGANCYQGPPGAFGPFTREFLITPPVSEDCLYLNVWTPGASGKGKPVYFFIHGGGFGSGSSSIPIYDGAHLAARGVVVVTLNYRLGVFGFLAHPDLTRESALHSSGNYGLEDIIAALQWVHTNIAAFGGDPALVTIAGQSAGAAAVNDLIFSKPARGLFTRAIAQSGSGMGIRMADLQEAETAGLDFAKKAGASGIQDLRAMSAADVQRLGETPPPRQGDSGPPRIIFAPNIDGSIVASAPDAEGAVESRVPLLTGFNADEGLIFGKTATTPAAFEAEVRRRYGDFADRLLAEYPHEDDQEATRSNDELARDRYMASLWIYCDGRSRSAGVPVFAYLYEHAYPGPDSGRYGSFHTAEVPYVFGALQQHGRQFDADDRRVSEQLQRYWINFMIHGDPNDAGLATWQAISEGNDLVMGLGDSPGARPAVSSSARLALLREYAAAGHTLSLF